MTENPTRTREASASTKSQKARANLYELEADAIKALAHPKRLMIVDLLSDGSERSVTELQRDTSLSQSNLSQNLAVLRAAGIVSTRRDRNVVYYHITDPRVLKAVILLRGVLATKLEDGRFIQERNAAKAKERAKNASIYSAAIGATLIVAFLIGVAGHPLFAGGDLADVGEHVHLMVTSPSMDAMFTTCKDVLTEPMAARPESGPVAAAA